MRRAGCRNVRSTEQPRARIHFLLLFSPSFSLRHSCSFTILTLLMQPMKLHSDRPGIQFLPNGWRLQVHRLGQDTTPCMLGTCERPELEKFLGQCILSPRGKKRRKKGRRFETTRIHFRELSCYFFVRRKKDKDTYILASPKLNSILAETRTEKSNKIKYPDAMQAN